MITSVKPYLSTPALVTLTHFQGLIKVKKYVVLHCSEWKSSEHLLSLLNIKSLRNEHWMTEFGSMFMCVVLTLSNYNITRVASIISTFSYCDTPVSVFFKMKNTNTHTNRQLLYFCLQSHFHIRRVTPYMEYFPFSRKYTFNLKLSSFKSKLMIYNYVCRTNLTVLK